MEIVAACYTHGALLLLVQGGEGGGGGGGEGQGAMEEDEAMAGDGKVPPP